MATPLLGAVVVLVDIVLPIDERPACIEDVPVRCTFPVGAALAACDPDHAIAIVETPAPPTRPSRRSMAPPHRPRVEKTASENTRPHDVIDDRPARCLPAEQAECLGA